MALADYAAYLAAKDKAWRYPFLKEISATAGVTCDWSAGPSGGALLGGTSAATSPSIPGTVVQYPYFGTAYDNQVYFSGMEIQSSSPASGMILIDFLMGAGEYVGNVATAQTTGLPSAALTRYTDGVGVFIGLYITSLIGTTATTVTCSYTNQAGTTGRTTQTVAFGGTGNREVGRFFVLPLQDGDYGARAVASVTLAATTGTAGGFDIFLFRPLAIVPSTTTGASAVQAQQWDAVIGGGGQLAPVVDGACMVMLRFGGTEVAMTMGMLEFIEVA